MKKITHINKFLIIAFGLLIIPTLAFAHQPRIVNGDTTRVVDPEISKAYYATLTGAPHTYTIDSPIDFDLYVSILLPDTKSADKSTTAEVVKDGAPIATLGGPNAVWKSFFEPFGQSSYLDGGEYKSRATAGVYTVTVKSQNNNSKYSLAIGEIEAFDGKEGTNALSIIPELKKDFFEESPISFIKSPFGWGMIVVLYVLAFIFGFIYRFIARKLAKSTKGKMVKNINKRGRLIRAGVGIALLLIAMLTTWSPVLIFISGFCIFESLFSWCAFNQMIGKNTCPVE